MEIYVCGLCLCALANSFCRKNPVKLFLWITVIHQTKMEQENIIYEDREWDEMLGKKVI